MRTTWENLSTWLIRTVFDAAAARNTRMLRRGAPRDVTVRSDIAYGPGPDELLDLYLPEGQSPEAGLPVVVWTHGGGWIAGDKSHYAGYYRRLASWGYAVVSLGYTTAPAAAYPDALRQIDSAHRYLLDHAGELGIDPQRVVLAGDSAGAQLTAQLAALITGPAPAGSTALEGAPALPSAALKGVMLHCGLYDLPKVAAAGSGIGGWGLHRMLSDYTGAADPQESPVLEEMSAQRHVTADFPPALITGGNGDPLTAMQSRPLADRLAELGVEVTEVFFDDDHRPRAPHEFQFDLAKAAGTRALDEARGFLTRTLGGAVESGHSAEVHSADGHSADGVASDAG